MPKGRAGRSICAPKMSQGAYVSAMRVVGGNVVSTLPINKGAKLQQTNKIFEPQRTSGGQGFFQPQSPSQVNHLKESQKSYDGRSTVTRWNTKGPTLHNSDSIIKLANSTARGPSGF